MLAFPEMMGMPSSRGRGIVKAIPTFVPTQRRPLAAERAVTYIDFLLLLNSLAANTRLTLLAMSMS